jgi:hypothetical protein
MNIATILDFLFEMRKLYGRFTGVGSNNIGDFFFFITWPEGFLTFFKSMNIYAVLEYIDHNFFLDFFFFNLILILDTVHHLKKIVENLDFAKKTSLNFFCNSSGKCGREEPRELNCVRQLKLI